MQGQKYPTRERHVLAVGLGAPVGSLNQWELTVIDTELGRTFPEVVGWYRNPSQATENALQVPYRRGGKWATVQPDFVFFSRKANGDYVASIVDPHGDHLSDSLDKLVGMAAFAERHHDRLLRMESLAKNSDGAMVSLDLTDSSVRAAIESAATASELFNGHHVQPVSLGSRIPAGQCLGVSLGMSPRVQRLRLPSSPCRFRCRTSWLTTPNPGGVAAPPKKSRRTDDDPFRNSDLNSHSEILRCTMAPSANYRGLQSLPRHTFPGSGCWPSPCRLLGIRHCIIGSGALVHRETRRSKSYLDHPAQALIAEVPAAPAIAEIASSISPWRTSASLNCRKSPRDSRLCSPSTSRA